MCKTAVNPTFLKLHSSEVIDKSDKECDCGLRVFSGVSEKVTKQEVFVLMFLSCKWNLLLSVS